MSNNPWSGRRVLVTGHTGFKGSWLIQWLVSLGAEVHGYALAPAPGPDGQQPLFAAAGLKSILASHTLGDIGQTEKIFGLLKDLRIEVIFHLAAQALVRDSYAIPFETIRVNTLGTASVLEAVRLLKAPLAVVLITSDKCYHNQEQIWGYREIDPMGGSDPYSASKGAAEIVAQCYRDSFFSPLRLDQHQVRLATVRAGNVIGGGDWAKDRLVPDLVRALKSGAPALIRNPKAIRPWQHVLEPLSGYLTIAEKLICEPLEPKWCSAWNFGPEPKDAWPVARLANFFTKLWGPKARWEDISEPNAPPEAGRLELSIDKARHILGWAPRWTIETALSKTAAWYLASTEKDFQAQKACQKDLEEYLAVYEG
ncbi:MAG: CDP-glucose 4,6-dehydratase [Deltaproteobacteria bacterium]|nr:CDP-glucose 4,6-dehydratase [Deltaproteobacteria bacterium]